MNKYIYNDKYFEQINTEEKAYWLGFLYADGCVSSNFKTIILELGIIDTEHIEKFLKSIESNKIIKNKNNKSSRLTLCSKKMAIDLNNLGCIPRKSTILKFPNEDIVPKELINHFIRGYFDGDGCLFFNYYKGKGRNFYHLQGEFNILGTLDFLDGIKKNIPYVNFKIIKNKNIYRLRVQNKEMINACLDYIYKDANIYLDRKYNKALEYKKIKNP